MCLNAWVNADVRSFRSFTQYVSSLSIDQLSQKCCTISGLGGHNGKVLLFWLTGLGLKAKRLQVLMKWPALHE